MKFHFGAWPWFNDLIGPLKRNFREVLVVSFFTNLLALAVPIFTLQVYDRVIAHSATSTLYALAVGVLIALLFDFVLKQARSRILQDNARYIDAVLGRRLYDKLSSLPLRTLESKPANYWQSLFNDIALIRSVFSGSNAVLVADIPFALIFVAVMFIIALPVAWVFLLVIPVFLYLTWRTTLTLNIDTAKEARKQQSREGLIAEWVAGRVTVKALLIDKALRDTFENLHADQIEQSYIKGEKTDFYISLGQCLTLATTVLLVLIGALAIMDREMTAGALIATTMLSSRVISPLNQLLGSWRSFASCRQAMQHLDGLFSLESEREEKSVAREKPKGRFTVENVSYGYSPDGPPLINEVSFSVEPGEIVGIIGRNGAGKTTLIKLLQGLYTPDSGRILLDGADISQFTRQELADWVGYVPQECFLFSGSVRENIAKAKPDATDDEILLAAKRSGADSFIVDMPDGYNTAIGEAGSRLSGGQRQRIAIARALLKQPPILLFDEITSNLDSQAELALRNHILELSRQHTIVLATHSMPLLRACHRIMAMERGRIVMMGPAQGVLARLATPDVMAAAQQGAQQQ